MAPLSVVAVMMVVVMMMVVMPAPVATPMVVMVVTGRRVVLRLDQTGLILFLSVGESQTLGGIGDRVEQLRIGLGPRHGGS